MISKSNPINPAPSARRRARIAAILAALACVASSAVLGTTAAQAAPSVIDSGPIEGWPTLSVGDTANDGVQNPDGSNMIYRIVEDKAPTFTWVQRDNRSDCIFYGISGNGLIRLDPGLPPYECSISENGTFRVESVVWSSLVGFLSTEGPISLDEGRQDSPNERFWVSDSPVQAGQPIDQFWVSDSLFRSESAPDVLPNKKTVWKAEKRNSEGGGDGASTKFKYRIVENGVPTQYFVGGSMSIAESGFGYSRDYDCKVYDHDPGDSTDDATDSAPYSCAINPVVDQYFRNFLAVDFTVKAL